MPDIISIAARLPIVTASGSVPSSRQQPWREGASYRYLDTGVREGGWYYWLEAVDTAGESEFFGPIAVLDPDDPGGGYQLHLGLILR